MSSISLNGGNYQVTCYILGNMERQWHSLRCDDIFQALNTSHSGLSETEAKARLPQYGANELKSKRQISPAMIFLRQFLSPLIYVLLVAAIISVILQDYIDAGVILGVLLVNAAIGFIQEIRAEKAMEALMQMTAPQARVERDGKVQSIPAKQIVPGDILFLETGDKIPADARLV